MNAIHPEPVKAVEKIEKTLKPDMVALWTVNSHYPKNVKPETADLLRDSNIRVSSWGAPYGTAPEKEGVTAAKEANKINSEFHIFDIEGHYESQYFGQLLAVANTLLRGNSETTRSAFNNLSKGQDNTLRLIHAFRDESDIAIVFCSFAWPYSPSGSAWHNLEMYKTFLKEADAGLPMAYVRTEKRNEAEAQVADSIRQWRMLGPNTPLIVGGRAYTGDGWKFSSDAAKGTYEAATQAHDNKEAIGMMWWSSYHAVKYGTAEEIKQFEPWGPPVPESERNATSVADYADSIVDWADQAQAQDALMNALKHLDNELREEGYDGRKPPLELMKLLSVAAAQKEGISINPEKWHTALTRRVFHAGQIIKNTDRIIY